MVSFCSISSTEMPRFSSSLRYCPTSSTILGARPSVGSSMMIRSGSPIRVRHKVSICCSPPDRTPASVCSRSLRRGNMAYMSSKDQREPLPEPLRPSNATISPLPTAKFTPCKTWLLPYQACRFSMRNISMSPCLLSGLFVGHSGAQVGFLHFGIGPHRLGGVKSQHLAINHHRDPVGQTEHHAHVVLHRQQGLAFGHFADQRNETRRLALAHAGGRLIEQD